MVLLNDFKDDKELLSKYSFIMNGSNRIKIYLYLLKDIKTLKEIQIMLNSSLPSVSRSMKELEKNGIAECINSSMMRGKLYQLTPDARKLSNLILSRSE
ncbi:MAG: ArsR family transcriptional regulator [Candidatus Odinarchaeota archaeon]